MSVLDVLREALKEAATREGDREIAGSAMAQNGEDTEGSARARASSAAPEEGRAGGSDARS